MKNPIILLLILFALLPPLSYGSSGIQEGEYYPTDHLRLFPCVIKLAFLPGSNTVQTILITTPDNSPNDDRACSSAERMMMQCSSVAPYSCTYTLASKWQSQPAPSSDPATWYDYSMTTTSIFSFVSTFLLHWTSHTDYTVNRQSYPPPNGPADFDYGNYQYAENLYPKLGALIKGADFSSQDDKSKFKNCVRHIEVDDANHAIIVSTSSKFGASQSCPYHEVLTANCRSVTNQYHCRAEAKQAQYILDNISAGISVYEYFRFLPDGNFVSEWRMMPNSDSVMTDKFYVMQ